MAHTDALLVQLDSAEADLAALRDQVSGRVALAAFPSAAATVVAAAWTALATSAPHVQLQLEEMEPEESLPAVLRGEADVAVAHSTTSSPGPWTRCSSGASCSTDPVLLAVPDGFRADGQPVPDGAPVLLASLGDTPFLAPRANTSCAEMIQRACARAGFVPRVVARRPQRLRPAQPGRGRGLVVTRPPAWRPGRCLRGLLLPPAEPVTRKIFTVSRRGGDRQPAVRVVLDAHSEAARSYPRAPLGVL